MFLSTVILATQDFYLLLSPHQAAGTLPQTALIIDASSVSTSNSLEQGTRRLEKTREKLATWLIVIFAITISVSFVVLPLLVLSVYFSFKPGNNNQNSTLDKELVIVVNPIKEFMVLVLTIESTLLGAALGFYFGEKSGIKK